MHVCTYMHMIHDYVLHNNCLYAAILLVVNASDHDGLFCHEKYVKDALEDETPFCTLSGTSNAHVSVRIAGSHYINHGPFMITRRWKAVLCTQLHSLVVRPRVQPVLEGGIPGPRSWSPAQVQVHPRCTVRCWPRRAHPRDCYSICNRRLCHQPVPRRALRTEGPRCRVLLPVAGHELVPNCWDNTAHYIDIQGSQGESLI